MEHMTLDVIDKFMDIKGGNPTLLYEGFTALLKVTRALGKCKMVLMGNTSFHKRFSLFTSMGSTDDQMEDIFTKYLDNANKIVNLTHQKFCEVNKRSEYGMDECCDIGKDVYIYIKQLLHVINDEINAFMMFRYDMIQEDLECVYAYMETMLIRLQHRVMSDIDEISTDSTISELFVRDTVAEIETRDLFMRNTNGYFMLRLYTNLFIY